MQRLLCLLILTVFLTGCTMSASTPQPQPDVPAADELTTQVPEREVAEQEAANTRTDPQQPITTTTAATTVPVLIATDTPPATEALAQEPPDWLTTVTVEDGLYILGNPNAPIRLIDYSDFL